jgi:zinc-ribbon domain
MYCPKCGTENPEDGKFCRSCGTDLEFVSAALAGRAQTLVYTVDPRKRGVSWEFAITKSFTGLAFLLISIILGISGRLNAANWWFWLLIPGFALLSSGVAQIYQLKKIEKIEGGFPENRKIGSISSRQNQNILPSGQTDFMMPPKQSIYDTDDLIRKGSVTDKTTRQLEIRNSDELIAIPKQ